MFRALLVFAFAVFPPFLFSAYCRSLLAQASQIELSNGALEAMTIEDRIVSSEDLRRLQALIRLCRSITGIGFLCQQSRCTSSCSRACTPSLRESAMSSPTGQNGSVNGVPILLLLGLIGGSPARASFGPSRWFTPKSSARAGSGKGGGCRLS